MKRLVVSDAARADLRSIAGYSDREWGTARRKQYLAAIQQRLALLRDGPEAGPVRRDISDEYRSLPVGRHMIFYRVEKNAIFIVRILHQRMDAAAHFPSSDRKTP
jgi:toxin ParE1/3/4